MHCISGLICSTPVSSPRVLAHAWIHLAIQAWVLARVLAGVREVSIATTLLVAIASTLLLLLVLLVAVIITTTTTTGHVALDGVQQQLQTHMAGEGWTVGRSPHM
jgi:hypothetical protein